MSESTSSPASEKNVTIRIPKALTWSDPILSASVLLQALTVIVAIKYLYLVLKYMSYGLFVLSIIELGTRSLFGASKGLVSQQRLSQYCSVNQKCIEKFATNTERFLKCASQSYLHFIDASHPGAMLAAATVCIIGSFAIRYVHPLTLATVALGLSFTVRPVYLAFRPEIEQCTAKLQKQTCGVVCCARSTMCQAVSPHIATINKKVPFVGESLRRIRGGSPTSKLKESDSTLMAEIPGPAADPHPEPVVKAAKISNSAAEPASAVTQDESSKTTSVPTLIGNIELDESYTKLVDEAVESVQRQ